MRSSMFSSIPRRSRVHAHAARITHHNSQTRRLSQKIHSRNRPYSTQASYSSRGHGKRSLPVIDWGDDSARHTLPQACRRDGFVYLKSAMPLATVQECLRLSQWFFGLDSSIKLRCQASRDTARRGYYVYRAASGADDAIECFSMGREVANPANLRRRYFEELLDLPADLWEETAGAKNMWPRSTSSSQIEAFDHFKQFMLSYFDECVRIGDRFLEELAVGQGLARDAFRGFHSQSDHTLELKYYPPLAPGVVSSNADDESERLKTHADLSSVTLLLQDSLGGLEVFNSEAGDWIEAPPTSDTLLCNTGDFMHLWTDGAYPSTKHRVVHWKNNGGGSESSESVAHWKNNGGGSGSSESGNISTSSSKRSRTESSGLSESSSSSRSPTKSAHASTSSSSESRSSSSRSRVESSGRDASSADSDTLPGRISVVFFYSPNYDAPARSMLCPPRPGEGSSLNDITWCGDKMPFVG